jgi:hypothetical protein
MDAKQAFEKLNSLTDITYYVGPVGKKAIADACGASCDRVKPEKVLTPLAQKAADKEAETEAAPIKEDEPAAQPSTEEVVETAEDIVEETESD